MTCIEARCSHRGSVGNVCLEGLSSHERTNPTVDIADILIGRSGLYVFKWPLSARDWSAAQNLCYRSEVRAFIPVST